MEHTESSTLTLVNAVVSYLCHSNINFTPATNILFTIELGGKRSDIFCQVILQKFTEEVLWFARVIGVLSRKLL